MTPRDSSRRAVLQTIGGGILLASGVGIATARQGKRKGASADATIFEIAEASDDFDTLEQLLEDTGLDAVLDGNRQYTVFAPTDAAFSGVDTSGLSLADIENILLYHVTAGRRYEPSVVNAPAIEMLNGDTVAVDGAELNGGQATITTTDIEASNGVVHVIDGVLLP